MMAESSAKKKSGRKVTWSERDLKTALQALKDGTYGLNECSRVYGISKPTLRRHLLNKNNFAKDGTKVRGRSTNLPASVEQDLVQHTLSLENMMFGITRKDLMSLAYQIAEANGVQHNFSRKRKTEKSTILTSSPYKKLLSSTQKKKNNDSGEKRNKPLAVKTHPKSKKRKTVQREKASIKKKPTHEKKNGNDESKGQPWYCFICDEDVKEDMIQSLMCGAWVHAACSVCGSQNEPQDGYVSVR